MWQSLSDLGPSLRARVFVDLLKPYIKELEPFDSLSAAGLLRLAGLLEPMPLAPEMDVCVQGDEATCIWILHEGSVEHLKGGKVVGSAVWAPGLLGIVALRGLRQELLDSGEPGTPAEGGESGDMRERPDTQLRGISA